MDVRHKTFTRADGQILDALACYRKTYNKKKQTAQSKLGIFLKNTILAKPSTSVDVLVLSTSY